MNRALLGRILWRHLHKLNVSSFSFQKVTNVPKPLVLTAPLLFSKNIKDNMDNFDMKLKEACLQGDAAIIELMEFLKTTLHKLAKSYKECLNKQIDLIDQATKAGPSSEKWDQLPELRTLAADLEQQMQNMVATVQAVGDLSENEALKYITNQEKQLKLINKKYKELMKVIKSQNDDFRKLEKKLLDKNKASITVSR